MVTTYWDMAALLVNQGAIPAEMFNEADTEHIALFAKLRPFLAEVRSATGYPDYLANIERVIGMLPQPEERVALFERYMARQRALGGGGEATADISDGVTRGLGIATRCLTSRAIACGRAGTFRSRATSAVCKRYRSRRPSNPQGREA